MPQIWETVTLKNYFHFFSRGPNQLFDILFHLIILAAFCPSKMVKKCNLYCKYWIVNWLGSFFSSDTHLDSSKKAHFKRKWPFFVLFMCIWECGAGLRMKMHLKKEKKMCIHITFFRECAYSFVNTVMIWIWWHTCQE